MKCEKCGLELPYPRTAADGATHDKRGEGCILALKVKLAEAETAVKILSKCVTAIHEALEQHHCAAPDSCRAHRIMKIVKNMPPEEAARRVAEEVEKHK